MSISVETLALAKKNTKQAVEEAVTSVYRYKGSVETLNDLPTSGQKVGDVYNVEKEAGRNYAWDGSNWDALGIAENLGDIEFTDSEGNTKTINEDFWDAEKVGGEINNLSNGLSDVSNTTNTAYNQANTAYNTANAAYDQGNSAYSRASSAYSRANTASNTANTAYNTANAAYNQANAANNSLNDLGNIEFVDSGSSVITTVTKDLTNDKIDAYGVSIRAREVKDGKITIKVTNNQDMPTVQYPSVFLGGYGPTPQKPVSGPGGSTTPSPSSNVDEYIYIIDSQVIQNDYYVFINNELRNMGQYTGFFFQGTLSYETEVLETHTINNDYYDKDATNSLANDTLNAAKAYTDSKFDISLKKEVVQTLPAEGEEDILYLVPKTDAETENIYDEYIWTNNEWELIGSTAIDLSGYYTSNEVDNIASNLNNGIADASNASSNAQNSADEALNKATNASNLAQAAYDAANLAAPAAWELVSTVMTNQETNSVTLPIDKNYDEYFITFNYPIKKDGTNFAASMTGTNGVLSLSIGGESVTGGKTDVYEKMTGVYTVENIVDNMYHATCYYNNIQGVENSYSENFVTINDATNGGAKLTMSYDAKANIASNVTITVYGKGGQETE